MGKTAAFIKKSNPLRSDLTWWAVAAMGIVALAVGIYILSAPQSARKNIVFATGIFLLLNGLSYAWAGIRGRTVAGSLMPYLLVRAGIGTGIGMVVIVNRFAGFMSLNPSRLVAGIGLFGMGVVTIVGMVVVRGDADIRLGAVIGALSLSVWGIAIFYQLANDSSSSRVLGWIAVIVGAVYCGIALLRRQRESTPAVVPA